MAGNDRIDDDEELDLDKGVNIDNLVIDADVINSLDISSEDKEALNDMLDKSPEEIEVMLSAMMDRKAKNHEV